MQTSPHDVAVDGVSISHQISWRRVPRERLGHLPSNPLGRWMCRYCVVNELPPAVRKKHQTVEQLEADRRHDEQICGGNSRCLIAQEGRPTLTRSSGAFDHVLGDGRLGDLDAELEQLAMNPGRTPQPVGAAHLPDQIADLSGDRWTAASAPGLPSPEGPKSLPMPADHRLRSDDRDGLHHVWA